MCYKNVGKVLRCTKLSDTMKVVQQTVPIGVHIVDLPFIQLQQWVELTEFGQVHRPHYSKAGNYFYEDNSFESRLVL